MEKETCLKNGVSRKYIKQNKELHVNEKVYRVRGCFKVLAAKHREITTNEIIQYRVYRRDVNQMIVTLPILFSYKKNPKIFSDGEVLGKIEVEFKDNNPNDMAIIIEFHFYDELIKVYAYREIAKNESWKEVQLQYKSKGKKR